MGLFIIILFIIVVVWLLSAYYSDKQYKEGSYYQVTKNPYSSVTHENGKHAEYLTYLSLRHFENHGGKFLFNIYIPKGNNQTTEIDVLLICSKGLFVFECKDYSGWIFGNESQRSWAQILPVGRGRSHKEYFYNPIKQNASHIRHLKNLIGWKTPMWSVIVFSNTCTLKSITVSSDDVDVANLSCAATVVTEKWNQAQRDIYTEAEINDIYQKLYPYTQLDYEEKEQHIKGVRSNFYSEAL